MKFTGKQCYRGAEVGYKQKSNLFSLRRLFVCASRHASSAAPSAPLQDTWAGELGVILQLICVFYRSCAGVVPDANFPY